MISAPPRKKRYLRYNITVNRGELGSPLTVMAENKRISKKYQGTEKGIR